MSENTDAGGTLEGGRIDFEICAYDGIRLPIVVENGDLGKAPLYGQLQQATHLTWTDGTVVWNHLSIIKRRTSNNWCDVALPRTAEMGHV